MRRILARILLVAMLAMGIPLVGGAEAQLLADYAAAGIDARYVEASELEEYRDAYAGRVVRTTLYDRGESARGGAIEASSQPGAAPGFRAYFQSPQECASLQRDEAFQLIGLVAPGGAQDFDGVCLWDCHVLATGAAAQAPPAEAVPAGSAAPADSGRAFDLLAERGCDPSNVTGIDAAALKRDRGDYADSTVCTILFFDEIRGKRSISARLTPDGARSFVASFDDPGEFSGLRENDIFAIAGRVARRSLLDFGRVRLSDCHIVATGLDAQAMMALLSGGERIQFRRAEPQAVQATATPEPEPARESKADADFAPSEAEDTFQPLRYGSVGDGVLQLQERLIALGYLSGRADGSFGERTQTALITFQLSAGLKANGICDAETATLLDSSNAPALKRVATPDPARAVLKRGDKGESVRKLQLRLIELGYLSGSADGDFGAKTEAALAAYQEAAGLPRTGRCDVDTRESLSSPSAPAAPTSAPTPKPTKKASQKKSNKQSNKQEKKANTGGGGSDSSPYIGNKHTKKFHHAYCSSVDQMKESNKVPLYSRDEAISKGYVPCKRCDP